MRKFVPYPRSNKRRDQFFYGRFTLLRIRVEAKRGNKVFRDLKHFSIDGKDFISLIIHEQGFGLLSGDQRKPGSVIPRALYSGVKTLAQSSFNLYPADRFICKFHVHNSALHYLAGSGLLVADSDLTAVGVGSHLSESGDGLGSSGFRAAVELALYFFRGTRFKPV